ncbi:MAG: PIG-L family deacetylase [Acidimicrobiales bacterium]
MAVHAHPDDEAIGTGGILARYSAEGIRTILVTCTDGACGDGPGGVKPGQPGHDRGAVAAARQVELANSCRVLGVSDHESLGYPDSGMMGWPDNDAPGSFWTTPVDEPASKLADLMHLHRPQVVVTYNPNGFYGHPDHIQTHRATMAAAEATGVPDKVYWTAVPKSYMADLGRRMRDLGLASPAGGEERPREDWGTPDEEVTTWVDVSAFADRKYDSISAHASQSDNIFFLQMGRSTFAEVMGSETFVRVLDRTGATVPENDLFAGLRRYRNGRGAR